MCYLYLPVSKSRDKPECHTVTSCDLGMLVLVVIVRRQAIGQTKPDEDGEHRSAVCFVTVDDAD